jgi:hypothetical protein
MNKGIRSMLKSIEFNVDTMSCIIATPLIFMATKEDKLALHVAGIGQMRKVHISSETSEAKRSLRRPGQR